MLKTPYAAPPTMTIPESAAPAGVTIVEAVAARNLGPHVPSHHVSRSDLSTVEVDDVRATALAWLSDIAKG